MARDGEDLISALPDDALHHVLFFLRSDDAVRTCVLARRWRNLWRSTRALRVTRREGSGEPVDWSHRRTASRREWTTRALSSFVNHFMLLRSGSPVDEFEITCGPLGYVEDYNDGDLFAGLWIRHALSVCHARVLRFSFRAEKRLRLKDVLFVSKVLARVEIADAKLTHRSLDFSSCPALEDLTLSSCQIDADRISSPSVTHLSITDGYFLAAKRTRISTPRLASLKLSVCNGSIPLLEKMPLLIEAKLRLDSVSEDICMHNYSCPYSSDDSDYSDASRASFHINDGKESGMYLENMTSCDRCYGRDDGSSILLEGLSSVTDLELISDPHVFILRKDCESGTTFSNLKTLLINEWCMAVDFGALVYFLQCSPVLEKLTLQLGHCNTRNPVVRTNESYSPMEQLLLVSKQLKIVEIKCPKENELVEKLLVLLMSNGVPRKQIHIEKNFSPPDYLGYETDETASDYAGVDW